MTDKEILDAIEDILNAWADGTYNGSYDINYEAIVCDISKVARRREEGQE